MPCFCATYTNFTSHSSCQRSTNRKQHQSTDAATPTISNRRRTRRDHQQPNPRPEDHHRRRKHQRRKHRRRSLQRSEESPTPPRNRNPEAIPEAPQPRERIQANRLNRSRFSSMIHAISCTHHARRQLHHRRSRKRKRKANGEKAKRRPGQHFYLYNRIGEETPRRSKKQNCYI